MGNKNTERVKARKARRNATVRLARMADFESKYQGILELPPKSLIDKITDDKEREFVTEILGSIEKKDAPSWVKIVVAEGKFELVDLGEEGHPYLCVFYKSHLHEAASVEAKIAYAELFQAKVSTYPRSFLENILRSKGLDDSEIAASTKKIAQYVNFTLLRK